MAKKKAIRKTTKNKTARKKATKKTATKRKIDLSKYSEAQLEAALNRKRSTAIGAIREKRADLMRRVSELDRRIQHLNGSARLRGGGTGAPRGERAAAVLRELRRKRTPKQLLESCAHLIGGKDKGVSISS